MLDQQILIELVEIRKNIQLLILLLRADLTKPSGDFKAAVELEELRNLHKRQELSI